MQDAGRIESGVQDLAAKKITRSGTAPDLVPKAGLLGWK
jgi:hypothetical protein